MELFERAHAIENTSSREDSRSDGRVKKQLKQMLYGYKQNDNDLIKKSATLPKAEFVDVTHSCTNPHNCQECYGDSSSVSGFSDLNLTNSDNEDEHTCEYLGPVAQSNTLTDTKQFSLDEALESQFSVSSNNSSSIENNNAAFLPTFESSNNIALDETSQTTDVTMVENANISQSDDINCDDQSSDSDKDNNSFISSPSEWSIESQSFDADGNLAKKILDKLAKSNTNLEIGNTKTRKINQSDEVSLRCKMGPLRNQYKPFIEEAVIADCNFTNNNVTSTNIDISSTSDVSSPPYVSVTATDMQSSTLDDVLGDYRHSTLRNMPAAIASNLSIFPIESNLEQIQLNNMSEMDTDIKDNFDESSQLLNDESMEVLNSENIMENEIVQIEQLSTESEDTKFVSDVKVFNRNNSCILIIKHPAELYIHGKVKLEVLYGVVEVFGYRLKQELCEVYAPNYNYSQCLKTVGEENLFHGLFGKLTSAGLTVAEAETVVTTIGMCDAIVRLYSLNSSVMDFVDKFASVDLFTKQNKSVENYLKQASNILGCSLYLSRPSKSFVEDSSWNQAFKSGLNSCSRGIVCGGKGTGKSTFLRYYVNKLLAKGPVAVIDLDPGQCEFTVAGSVSVTVVNKPLLGPNFTHLRTPEMQLNLGLINTMDNPRRYVEGVHSLISYCHNNERIRGMPWIVNTMGMCNDVGLKFMSCIILLTLPTFILQMDSKNAKKRFEYHLNSTTIKRLFYENYIHDYLLKNITLPDDLDYSFLLTQHGDSVVKNNLSLAARDERYLNFLAYFGELLEIHGGNGLLSITPYEVSMRDLNIALNAKVDKNLVMQVINGKVVGLCQHSEGDNEKTVFTLRDKPLLCHGHGLIRGIDYNKEVLYVLTPLSSEKLSLVNTLLYADWMPELRGQEQQLPIGTPIPYRTDSAYNQRQLMFAPKRRFNPLQLLKMSRKPKLKVS